MATKMSDTMSQRAHVSIIGEISPIATRLMTALPAHASADCE
jgi:hypothetical protein